VRKEKEGRRGKRREEREGVRNTLGVEAGSLDGYLNVWEVLGMGGEKREGMDEVEKRRLPEI
jgi:hypothetical protein